MRPTIRRAGTAGLLFTLLAAPPMAGFVSAEEQAGEAADVNPEQVQQQPRAKNPNLAKHHEELNKRRADREQRRQGRYQAADKANGEPAADAEN